MHQELEPEPTQDPVSVGCPRTHPVLHSEQLAKRGRLEALRTATKRSAEEAGASAASGPVAKAPRTVPAVAGRRGERPDALAGAPSLKRQRVGDVGAPEAIIIGDTPLHSSHTMVYEKA